MSGEYDIGRRITKRCVSIALPITLPPSDQLAFTSEAPSEMIARSPSRKRVSLPDGLLRAFRPG